MKIRNGFVSNSSSSSFIIKKDKLTKKQIKQILNYKTEAYKLGKYPIVALNGNKSGEYGFLDLFWTVKEDNDSISASTIIDNFSFDVFLADIGVKSEKIEWEDDKQ